MGYEAMAIWLTDELGINYQRINFVLSVVDQLKAKERWEFELEGQDYQLTFSRDQATVRASLLDSEMDSEEMEDMDCHYYDSESSSSCGLDDFKTMLHSWQEFISQ